MQPPVLPPIDLAAREAARVRQAQLTKPPGSLAQIEAVAIQIAGIRGEPRPRLDDAVVYLLAGDHGITAAGVSAFPAEVTAQMVLNFAHGGAAICALARAASARLVVADIGVASVPRGSLPCVDRRVREGTRNFAVEPALTRDEVLAAIDAGRGLVREFGGDLIAIGEMGIGNTTAAAAVTAALLGCDPEAVTGAGTGLDLPRVEHKAAVIRRALALWRPSADDPLGVLAAVGGLEIAGLVGVMIEAATRRAPVVLDGLICCAAALAAVRWCPALSEFLFAAHEGAEPGHARQLRALGLEPLLRLGLRLGEGSGAALAIPLVRAALAVHDEMATFAEAGVSEG